MFPKPFDSWGYSCFSKQTPIIQGKALSIQAPMCCRKAVCVEGSSGYWGLQIRRGISSLRRKTGKFFHVHKYRNVLWQRTYHFFLWHYLRAFLIAIVKSPPLSFLLGFPFLLLINLFVILFMESSHFSLSLLTSLTWSSLTQIPYP